MNRQKSTGISGYRTLGNVSGFLGNGEEMQELARIMSSLAVELRYTMNYTHVG